MKKSALFAAFVAVLAAAAAYALMPKQTTPHQTGAKSLADFTVKDIEGKDVKLDKYKGKVVMVVNVASKCGNTPQYEGLEALYQEYKDQGFVVLGFPSNQFAGQEPGTDAEILEFCRSTYSVDFPMFSKVDVKGENAAPIYKWLIHSTKNSNDVEWNFGKFLIGKDGKTVTRFSPKTQPGSDDVVAAIEAALKG